MTSLRGEKFLAGTLQHSSSSAERGRLSSHLANSTANAITARITSPWITGLPSRAASALLPRPPDTARFQNVRGTEQETGLLRERRVFNGDGGGLCFRPP